MCPNSQNDPTMNSIGNKRSWEHVCLLVTSSEISPIAGCIMLHVTQPVNKSVWVNTRSQSYSTNRTELSERNQNHYSACCAGVV